MKSTKDSTLNLNKRIVSIVLALSAFLLLFLEKEGWGWFLFGSIFIELELLYRGKNNED